MQETRPTLTLFTVLVDSAVAETARTQQWPVAFITKDEVVSRPDVMEGSRPKPPYSLTSAVLIDASVDTQRVLKPSEALEWAASSNHQAADAVRKLARAALPAEKMNPTRTDPILYLVSPTADKRVVFDVFLNMLTLHARQM